MTDALFIPISDLPARYGIARQTVRDRMIKLGVPSTRMDGQKYISVMDLERLDQYHQQLIAKEKGDLVIEKKQVDDAILTGVRRVESQPDLIVLIEKIVDAVRPFDHLSVYRAVQEASDNEWVLSSDKVHELTGRKPSGDGFIWGKFRVVRCGRLGRGVGWLIVRE